MFIDIMPDFLNGSLPKKELHVDIHDLIDIEDTSGQEEEEIKSSSTYSMDSKPNQYICKDIFLLFCS
jgi:hypothetical protein